MSKVLYISHHRENTGSGEAARNYILALDAAGVDIVPRPVRLGVPSASLPKKILELEQKSAKNCDVCIQHVLPHHMFFDGRFKKNIALLVVDTQDWYHSGWNKEVNQFDEVWVPNNELKSTATNNKVTVPVKVIPHAFNLEKYTQKYPKVDIKDTYGNYIFYTISEYNRRKRIIALIEAFHLEFSRNEPVSLLIKTHKPNTSQSEVYNLIKYDCDSVKSALKLYPSNEAYHKEILLTNNAPEEQVYSIHKSSHCYVTSSFGEAFCIPAFEAMAFGNSVVAPNIGGPKDFLSGYNKGYLANGRYVPVTGMNETFQNLHTGREKWFSVDVSDLAGKMRQAYENRDLKPNNEKIQLNGYEYIGNLMKKEL